MTTNNEFCEKNDTFPNDNVKKSHNEQDLDHIVDVSKKVSLTEQWKKGKLKTGWYYVSRNNNVEMLEYVGDYFLSVDVPLIDDKDVSTLEVLSPVPSYGDCLINEALIKDLSKKVNKLIEENQRLKSLLKDLRELIGNNFVNHKMRVLLTEIDEALK